MSTTSCPNPTHTRAVELYCETCEEMICFECIMRGNKHHNHDYEKLQEIYERSKSILEKQGKSYEEKRESILQNHETVKAEIQSQFTNIQSQFTKIRELLETRKRELIDELSKRTQEELDSMEREAIQNGTQQDVDLDNLKEVIQAASRQAKKLSKRQSLVPDIRVQCPTLKPLLLPIFVRTVDGLEGPEGIATNCKTGEIIVTEHNAKRVTILSHSGEKIRSFSYEKLTNPSGVAVDKDGNILVANCRTYNGHFYKFSALGKFLTEGTPTFHWPCGIAFNSKNNRVYVSDDSHCFILDCDTLTKFSSLAEDDTFRHPRQIACDNDGNVFVADRDHQCIQVFTSKGRPLKKFDDDDVGKPWGVAVSGDRVYISDYYKHRVSIFTSEGKFLSAFGSLGNAEGEFNSPNSIAVSNGMMYVCDYKNNRLQLYLV